MAATFPMIPNFRPLEAGLYCSGQPGPGDWAALQASGVRSVINLRAPAEQAEGAEQGHVESAGLAYAQVPVADGAALGRTLVARVHEAMQSLPAPWLVHCASGNRVGAVLALRAAWHLGAGPEAAVQLGRRAGLDSLEPIVRQQLALPGR